MTMPRDHQKTTCAVCGGPITYYARKTTDLQPRTSSIDDRKRWAHDDATDWWNHPHRATPKAAA